MTPRNQIHALDLAAKPSQLAQQLATSYHTRLPAYEDELDNIVGVIHLKQVVASAARRGRSSRRRCARSCGPAYFVPGRHAAARPAPAVPDRPRAARASSSTNTASSRAWSTIEDIIEEIIGDFTTQAPGGAETLSPRRPTAASSSTAWRRCARSTASSARNFPLDGPKTLNGLIVDHLGEIPDAGHACRASPARRSKSCRRRTVA